jgi:hypothetical protein
MAAGAAVVDAGEADAPAVACHEAGAAPAAVQSVEAVIAVTGGVVGRG